MNVTIRVFALIAAIAAPLALNAQTSSPATKKIAAMVVAVDGQRLGTVTNVNFVSTEIDSLIQAQTAGTLVRHQVGLTIKAPLDNELLAWRQEVVNGVPGSKQRTLTITAFNAQGVVLIAWSLTDAWPTKIALVRRTKDAIIEKARFTFATIDRSK